MTLSRLPGFVTGDKPGPLHCPFTSFLYREKKLITYKVCTATLNLFNLVAPGFAKSAPYPPCHRDRFSAKVPGHCPDAPSANTTSLYCRAVRLSKNLLSHFHYIDYLCINIFKIEETEIIRQTAVRQLFIPD